MNPNLLETDHSIVLEQLDWSKISNLAKEYLISIDNALDLLQNKEKKDLADIFLNTHFYIDKIEKEELNLAVREYSIHLKSGQINQLLGRIQKDAYFSIDELNDIALIYQIHQIFNSHNLPCYDLDIDLQSISKFFIKDFRKIVNIDGSFDYLKHPKIRVLYEDKQALEKDLRDILKYIQSSTEWKGILQFDGHDVINDYFVLAVRADAYNNDLGKIISRSDTGQTLYIAPYQTLKKGREIAELGIQIDRLIFQWVREQVKILQSFLPDLRKIFSNFVQFDLSQTRANFALSLKLNAPDINKDNKIVTNLFFHPLLENPVKNSITIDGDKLGLIISGPNTGGKSVTLKTIALNALLMKKGFYVPAHSCSMPVYTSIFYLSLDGQNLQDGISSFASEVKSFQHILDNLTDNNLIVIDEIFNSTSSEEASSLAMSLFEYLNSIDKQVHVICSTHHQTLKTMLHDTDYFTSAHVGFNLENQMPTYKVHVGEPGSSFAIEIFRKLTVHNSWSSNLLDKAITYSNNMHINYEKLLSSLARKEQDLNSEITKYHNLNKELLNQKDSMKGVLKLKMNDELDNFKRGLEKKSQKLKQLINDVKNDKKVSKRSAELAIHDARKELFPEAPAPKAIPSDISPSLDIKVSHSYYSAKLGTMVKVLFIDPNKKIAQVGKGTIKLKLPYSDLFQSKSFSKPVNEVHVNVSKSSSSQLEYDCRGMRLSEFQDLVEYSSVNVMTGDTPFACYIHGHGEGTLKKWIRAHFRNHPDLIIDHNESGNDGETRIVLRNS